MTTTDKIKTQLDMAKDYMTYIAMDAHRMTAENVKYKKFEIHRTATGAARYLERFSDMANDSVAACVRWFDTIAERITTANSDNAGIKAHAIRVFASDARRYIVNEIQEMEWQEAKNAQA